MCRGNRDRSASPMLLNLLHTAIYIQMNPEKLENMIIFFWLFFLQVSLVQQLNDFLYKSSRNHLTASKLPDKPLHWTSHCVFQMEQCFFRRLGDGERNRYLSLAKFWRTLLGVTATDLFIRQLRLSHLYVPSVVWRTPHWLTEPI